jgi:hypothetical protein
MWFKIEDVRKENLQANLSVEHFSIKDAWNTMDTKETP